MAFYRGKEYTWLFVLSGRRREKKVSSFALGEKKRGGGSCPI